ncbi:MAG TPA: DsbA family oxidoreductase [Fibrobacteria bacterium]|nr:DsbA family oxidoreductase [Fibrobacteria bacterium]
MEIEIWSDIVCPWCYIGKRRFEAALERFERRDAVEFTWRSYLLDPSAPRTPSETTRAMLARKYGVSLEQADAMQARVKSVAAGEGLNYKIDLTRHESSVDAHRLLHLAKASGLQDALKERFFSAHFIEGLSISDAATLSRIAVEVGLKADEVSSVLAGNAYADDVKADIERAGRLGIRGVPFFLIAGRYGVSGAQSSDTMLEAMRTAWAETEGQGTGD